MTDDVMRCPKCGGTGLSTQYQRVHWVDRAAGRFVEGLQTFYQCHGCQHRWTDVPPADDVTADKPANCRCAWVPDPAKKQPPAKPTDGDPHRPAPGVKMTPWQVNAAIGQLQYMLDHVAAGLIPDSVVYQARLAVQAARQVQDDLQQTIKTLQDVKQCVKDYGGSEGPNHTLLTWHTNQTVDWVLWHGLSTVDVDHRQ